MSWSKWFSECFYQFVDQDITTARPQEFDVGLAFNHWKRDGRPERLEFSFPGLIVLYSFLGFNLQDESIFRTSPLTAKKMENSSFPGNRPSRSAWSSRGNRPARSYQRLESISSSISYLSRMLSDGSNFQIEENNNPEEVGTLGHLLAAANFFSGLYLGCCV